jgi:hypothetical protein
MTLRRRRDPALAGVRTRESLAQSVDVQTIFRVTLTRAAWYFLREM